MACGLFPLLACCCSLALAAAAGAGGRRHHWPTVRGRPESLSTSPYAAPQNISSSLAWTDQGAYGKYSVPLMGAILIDDQSNLYHHSAKGVQKFTAEGRLIWTYPTKGATDAPVLAGDSLYGNDPQGNFFRLDLETGRAVWSVDVSGDEPPEQSKSGQRYEKPQAGIGGGIGAVGYCGGVVIGKAGASTEMGGATHIVALNGTNGDLLWAYHAEQQLWNFEPWFPDGASFVWQDQAGGAFRTALDGTTLWRNGHLGGNWAEVWTDGMILLVDSTVYVMHANLSPPAVMSSYSGGDLSAYNVDDGRLIWRKQFPYPPNSQPVVGRLSPDAKKKTVVMPVGMQAGPPIAGTFPVFVPDVIRHLVHHFNMWLGEYQRFFWWFWPFRVFPSGVFGLDVDTGEELWRWDPPVWRRPAVAGDDEGLLHRISSGHGGVFCIPNPFASPTMDATGAVYLGYQDGHLYILKDANADGVIDGTEVSSFYTGSGFSHPGPAIAPGILAVAGCDTLYVFRDK
mmetsp:Transcript_112950/g.319587  ORF Transcript_112950/g.319587 Transcript_112950/m.319587 type:complete len:510 (+) Transcript_112950:59-1588(+)|eukprot:CAMPEP_0168411022 /NCGR_PEP_ID=MMETSP0228-20121227/27991_1 /TAXON_ID=133427 /ORGANISM="Protoceratium reticulatum, Strain CCCM 535 (=CCMP 1889)" /LENGTH=509 /DNA_ID=CAMNT_0008424765 /DNA_START=29 /DNA_END=1558 /DNA_ORIENTATION=+